MHLGPLSIRNASLAQWFSVPAALCRGQCPVHFAPHCLAGKKDAAAMNHFGRSVDSHLRTPYSGLPGRRTVSIHCKAERLAGQTLYADPERPVYIVCTGGGQAIGFLRMKYAADNAVELVVAIGEEAMWGRGYGRACLSEALIIAFFEMRRDKIIAHVYNENRRSRQMFVNRGFIPEKEGEKMIEYQLTLGEYLHPQDEQHMINA